MPGNGIIWGDFHDRFDVDKEPNEANRFGWIVEIDPYDPDSVPIKRTALGRYKHEGAEAIINKDGRVVVYMRRRRAIRLSLRFVTDGTFNPNDRAANRGCSMTARSIGRAGSSRRQHEWLPLVQGQGPLTAANGFTSQADVLIETRLAADCSAPRTMDRPEDVEPNPKTNKVYVMLTNNNKRKPSRSMLPIRAPTTSRPYRRADAARRRSRGGEVQLGCSRQMRRSFDSESAPVSHPATTKTAGSACRITARSTPRAGCGSPPTGRQ